jgi:hypothetical protein
MEKQSNSTGDRAIRFELQETTANIECSRFRMFVHHAFLCTNARFGLHFVDHGYLTASSNKNRYFIKRSRFVATKSPACSR